MNFLNKNWIINNLIFKTEIDDESALYFTCKLGKLEIFYIILFFVEIDNFEKKINSNFILLSPIHISFINGHYTKSLYLKKYFNISDYEIKNIFEKYKNKINLYFYCNLEKKILN